MLPIHTILYATDLSDPAARAFPLACSLARDQGARLVVLHVVPPPIAHGEVVARRQENGYIEELLKQVRKLRAPEDNVNVEHRVSEGDPASEILRVAEETKAGLVVMGTHGRTGLGRLLMGSVAEQVVRKAVCPVLTLKTALKG